MPKMSMQVSNDLDKCFDVLSEEQFKSSSLVYPWLVDGTMVYLNYDLCSYEGNPCMARYKNATDIIGPLSISAILDMIFRIKTKQNERQNRGNTKTRNMEFVGLLDGHIQQINRIESIESIEYLFTL